MATADKARGKGGKAKKRAKNKASITAPSTDKVRREEGQEYGTVKTLHGTGHFTVACWDGVDRLCHIRGNMRKKSWITQVLHHAPFIFIRC